MSYHGDDENINSSDPSSSTPEIKKSESQALKANHLLGFEYEDPKKDRNQRMGTKAPGGGRKKRETNLSKMARRKGNYDFAWDK